MIIVFRQAWPVNKDPKELYRGADPYLLYLYLRLFIASVCGRIQCIWQIPRIVFI